MIKNYTSRQKTVHLILFFIVNLSFLSLLQGQVVDYTLDVVPCNAPPTNRGRITVTITGGTANYNYILRQAGFGTIIEGRYNRTETSTTFTGLAEGSYSVIVYHNDSDPLTGPTHDGVLAEAFDNIKIEYLGTNAISVLQGLTCNDGHDAILQANPKGGFPPYTYLWSNGDTDQTAEDMGTGNHSVTITDSKGCNTSINIVFQYPLSAFVPPPITVSSTTTGTCLGLLNGTITVNGSGGTGDLDYAIVNTATLDSVFQETNVFSNLPAGTYRVYVIDNNGCIKKQAVNATVTGYANPTATITPDPAVVCAGEDLSLNGNPGGGTLPYTNHSWTGPDADSLSSKTTQSTVFNSTVAGNYSVTYTVTDTRGCVGTDDITISVNALPVVSASNNGPVCEGQQLQVFSLPDGMSSYSWSGPNSFSSNSQNPIVSGSATMSMAGLYLVTVTNSNSCKNTANTTVTIIQAPTADAGTDATICEGSTHTLAATATNYASLLWTTSGTGLFNNNAIEDPVYTPSAADITSGFVILTLTATGNAPCGAATDNMRLNITAAPDADAGVDATICEGSTHTLAATASNYASLLWTTSGTGSFNNNAIEDPVYTPSAADITAGSVILTLTATGNAPCGNDVDAMQLNITAAPDADAGVDAAICAGSTYTLAATATNYASLLWTTSGTGSFSNATIEDPVYTPSAADITAGFVILTLTATGNAPCGNDVDAMQLNITAAPDADAGVDATICEGSTYTLAATATNYASLLWTTSGTGSFNNNAIEDPVYTPSADDITAGSVILTLTATGNAPCGNDVDAMQLNITAAPDADAGVDATICEGSTHTLAATAANYASLLWTTSGTGSFNNNAIKDPVYTPSAADITAGFVILTLTATGNAPCGVATDNMRLNITAAPAADAGPDATICSNTTHTLAATASNYASLLWTTSGTGSFSNATIEDPVYTPSADDITAGSVILTLTATGNAPCGNDVDAMQLNITTAPDADAGVDATICEGSTHTLAATATNYASLLWTTSGTGSFSNATIEDPVYTPSADDITAGFVILTLTATGNAPCGNDVDAMQLNITAAPDADAGVDATICEGSTYTLAATATNYASLLWTTSGTGSFSNATIEDPVYTPSADDITAGFVILTLTATGNAPCGNDDDAMQLNITAAPDADAGVDATICEGSTHTLAATATNYASLLWTTSGTGSFNNNAIEDPVYTPSAADITAGFVILTLTATGNAPCGNDVDAMQLNITAAPVADAGVDATICEGSTYTLAATATNYASLLWTTSGTGSFSNATIEDPVYTPSAADITSGSVTLTLTVTGNAPCGNDADAMQLNITAAPDADAGPDATICEGSTHTLAATAANYASLLWTTSGTGSFNNNAIEDPVYTPSAADITAGFVILTLTATGNAPCGVATDNMRLNITAAPAADAGPDATICSNTTHTLAATASNYASLLWTTSGTGSFNNNAIEDPVYTPSADDITAGFVILTLTATGNAPCGNDVDAMQLNITTAPDADAGVDATICEGSTHTLAATATNYASLLWTTSGTGSFSNATIEDPVYTPSAADITAGFVILTLTATGNAPCGNDVDAMQLNITAAPDADAGVDATICEGSTYTLAATATNYASLLWTTSGTGSFNNNAIEDPVYTPSADDITAGFVILTLTATGNAPCGNDVDAMQLNITAAPDADAGVDATICEGSTHTLAATAANYASLLWTTSGTGSFNNNAIEDPVYTPSAADITAGFVILTLTATGNAPCGVATDNMRLNITAAPAADAGPDATICSNTTHTLAATASNYASLLWTTSGTGSFSNATIEDPVYTPSADDITAGSVILTLTATGNAPCGNDVDAMQLNITTAPDADAGVDATICEGSTHTLAATATNYASLLWTTSGTGSFSNATIEDPVYTPSADDITAGFVILTLTATGNAPCGNDVDAMQLNITAAPDADAGVDATICEGSTYTLAATATNYASLLWTTSGTGSFSNATIEDPVYTPSADDITAGFVILTLTATGNAPCGNDADAMQLNITAAPDADAGVDATICEGSTHTLAATATNYASLLWTTSGTGSFNNNAIEDPVYTPSAADITAGFVILTLTATGNAPCGNDVDAMQLNITAAPVADAGVDATICEGSTYTLAATAINYASLLWTTSGTGSFSNATIEDPVYTPSAADIISGIVTLTLTATGNAPCGDVADAILLTISPIPVADAFSNSPVCVGEALNLGSLPNGMSTYEWSGPNGFTSDQQNPVVSVSATLAMAGNYYLTVTSDAGCTDRDTITVVVTPAPEADAGPDASICFGDTLFITGATASNYSALLWTSSSGYNGFNDNTILNPYYVPGTTDQANGQVTLYLRAFGIGPCGSEIDSMILTLPPQLQVSISSVSPFVIGPNTEIEVSFSFEDHLIVQDLGYFLVAPDGFTMLTLKDAEDPGGACNFYTMAPVDLTFSNLEPADDTIGICDPGLNKDISGTYNITGDWSSIYGQNPRDGGWAIQLNDYFNTEGSGNPDGRLTHASITFTDTSIFTGELTTIQFESGVIDIPITEGDGFSHGGLTYAVPQGLRVSCYGACDALALVDVTGGTPPYVSYNWDDPSIPDTDSVFLCEGTYSVTVTDALGCTGSTTVTVLSPPAILITDVEMTDTLECHGIANGYISVEASGGTGTLTYRILPDVLSEEADSGYWSGMGAGTYVIRIEDAMGCFKDTTLRIYQPGQIQIDALVTDSVFCTGDNNGRIEATATGGTSPYTFILEPDNLSNSTGIFENLGPGSYTVRVTDINNCDTVDSELLILGVPVPLEIDTVIVEPIACNGDEGTIVVVIEGGKPPYEVYVDGVIEQTGIVDTAFISRGAGSYSISAEDANSCNIVWAPVVTISSVTPIVLDSINITSIETCYNYPDGAIAVYISGGSGIFEYSLDGVNYQDTNVFEDLTGGLYSIYYRDENGCNDSTTAFIGSPPPLIVDYIVTNVMGDIPGSILLDASGGTPFTPPNDYLYSIDGGPLTNDPLFDTLDVGWYIIHVEDSLGCPWDDTIYVDEDVLEISLQITNMGCHGDASGEIRIDFIGGVAPYDVYFSPVGDPLALLEANIDAPFYRIVSIPPGDYNLRVEDVTSRRVDRVVTIISPPPLVLSKDIKHVTCHELNLSGVHVDDGYIHYGIEGGVGDYDFHWEDEWPEIIPPNSSFWDNAREGRYIFTVTDENGCRRVDTTYLSAIDSIGAQLWVDLEGSNPNRLMTETDEERYPYTWIFDTMCYLSNWIIRGEYNQDLLDAEHYWTPSNVLDNPEDSTELEVSYTSYGTSALTFTVRTPRCMHFDIIALLKFPDLGMRITTGPEIIRIEDSIVFPAGKEIGLIAREGFDSYLWDASDDFDNDTSRTPILIPLNDQMITVIGTTPDRCYEHDTVYLTAQRSITVFDVFTPNDDGVNDFWHIPNAEQYRDIEVLIYDRWGQKIFYSSPYGIDEFHMWDGKSQKNGKDLPVGSYYYIIKYNDGTHEPVYGTVTIVR